MRKTTSNLPVLDTGFADQLTFCMHVAPLLEDRQVGFENLDIYTIRKVLFFSGGWRLTGTGCQILAGHYSSYSSQNDANTVVTGKILLNMDTCCASPWSLRGKSVTVFDPILHFELQMVGGKLNDFIDFKSPAKM